jgi:hypothetical protein
MRQVILAWGCSLIVLVLIAGCTTPQHAPCNLSSTDPIKFQKFLPDIPGYEREFGQNISVGDNYRKDSPGWLNGIEDHYKISGQNTQNTVSVSFYDLGPCVNESTGVFARLNTYHFGIYLDTIESRVTFHGYPAIHVIRTIFPSELIRSDSYSIGISNRLYVVISRYTSPDKKIPLSEAEADIEKFANAIDFNGLASTV